MLRLSYGTAAKVGIIKAKIAAEPTTAYIMLGEKCVSNCSFCAQARTRGRSDYLSRVLWIPCDEKILSHLTNFSRICFQVLDYPGMVDDVVDALKNVPKDSRVSVSIVPISFEDMKHIKDAGAEGISIALDAVTEDLFKKVKGEYVGNRFRWNDVWRALEDATKIFSIVNTHIIVGLGETDRDIYTAMVKLANMGVSVALFSYTPIVGGNAPELNRYRSIQLLRYLIFRGYSDIAEFDEGKLSVLRVPLSERKNIERGLPFMTSGCPGCNRPFYNERPSGNLYNYPFLPDTHSVSKDMKLLQSYAHIEWIQ